MTERVLLTGATGYLGGRIASLLAALPQPPQVTALARGAAPEAAVDTVVHCAADYGRGGADPARVAEANLELPTRLLAWALEHGARRFINVDTLLPPSVSHYAATKRAFRDRLQQASGRIAAVNFALEQFFGPGEPDGRFVAWAVRSLLRQVPSLPLTAGEQVRDFIHVDDVLGAFSHVWSATQAAQPGWYAYEVGSGRPLKVRRMVELARDLCGNTATKLDFGAVPLRPGEPMEVPVDLRAIRALGWAPRYSLAEGLAAVIAHERNEL